ncbi:MAG TPA: hypothetical protein VFW07_05230 [Parafilimonas sp.]|nr:hypothetical protein [Parafilimonas sp.]
MRRTSIAVLFMVAIAACKNPETDISGEEIIKADDFLKAFQSLDLPLLIADSSLKNFGDSTRMSKTVFLQFFPDSALQRFSGDAGNKLVINPAGIIHKKERDLLLMKFSSPKKIQLGVFVLNDKHAFLASLPLLSNIKNDNYNHSMSITEEPTFIFRKEKFTADNKSLYSRNGFAYSTSSNSFAEVLHDSNEDTDKNNEIINPIDTFPSTNKFSGDYVSNKRNFISIRNGKNALTYTFFIHFENSKGDCTGELKGTMSLTDEKNAVFTESGDPCVINFKFTSAAVKVKEEGNCGNHRGITCPFDFTFKKKKPEKKSK